MAGYYNEAWYGMSLKWRVRLAESKLLIRKHMLEETRADLRVIEKTRDILRNSYRPLQSGSPGISFIDETMRKAAYQDYLDAFTTYMIAKVECDRLKTELRKQQHNLSHKRPSLNPHGAPEGVQRSSLGMRVPIIPAIEPTGKGIDKALREAERKARKDPNDPRARSLLKAIAVAAGKMAKASIDKMEGKPSEKNLDIALSDATTAVQMGSDNCDSLKKKIMQLGRVFIEKQRDDAEKEFRRDPSLDKFDKFYAKIQEFWVFGGSRKDPLRNIKRRLPPGKYTVQKDDTLSSISEKYYGSPGYWDVIYLANLGVIGNNPYLIQPSIILNIP